MQPGKTLATLALLALSGCASMAVTEDALQRNTGFALALQPGEFTISNRSDEGLRTRYQVQTKAGREYDCYVGGAVGLVGRVVTDAVCTEMGKSSSTQAPPAPNCNALLRSAGKC